jgi:excisionase family DNA binding protein
MTAIPRTSFVPRGYVSVEEAAERLGLHVQTVRQWLNSGKITESKIPGSRRRLISEASLERARRLVQQ